MHPVDTRSEQQRTDAGCCLEVVNKMQAMIQKVKEEKDESIFMMDDDANDATRRPASRDDDEHELHELEMRAARIRLRMQNRQNEQNQGEMNQGANMQATGDEQQQGQPGQPGLNADDVAARLNFLQGQRNREVPAAARAHANANVLPTSSSTDSIGWRPPYAWDPSDRHSVPAIFTHPRWANGPMYPTDVVDPPLVPDIYSQRSGVPLQFNRTPSRYVREMTDRIHEQGIFRTGDVNTMPYTSFGVMPDDGDQPLPPALVVEERIPNRIFSAELNEIHRMQQANIQQAARRKGKGIGKDKGHVQDVTHPRYR